MNNKFKKKFRVTLNYNKKKEKLLIIKKYSKKPFYYISNI